MKNKKGFGEILGIVLGFIMGFIAGHYFYDKLITLVRGWLHI